MRKVLCVVVLATLVCCSFQIDCRNIYSEIPEYVTACVQEEEQDDESVAYELDPIVTWSIMDSKKGKVSVDLKLPFRNYTLELLTDESITDGNTCYNMTYVESDDVHSERHVWVLESNPQNMGAVPKCGQSVKVIFSHVFTGCYFLTILPYGSPHPVTTISPEWISTEYVKTPLSKPVIANQYIQASKELRVTVHYDSLVDLSHRVLFAHNVDASLGSQACYESGQVHSCCEYRHSGQIKCAMQNIHSSPPSCKMESDDLFRCTFHNVSAGLYCVMFRFVGDLSIKGTLWNRDNRYYIFNNPIVNITNEMLKSPVLPPRLPSVPFLTISLSVFAVVCVTLLAVLLVLWRRRLARDPIIVSQLGMKMESHKPQILLLYARDCKPFMVFMETFRHILKEATKCEVMDCFDTELAEQISCNKTYWLRQHLTSSAVRVVVLETQCAALHEEGLVTGRCVSYAEPQWLDDLFVYGLKTLSDQLDKNTYERVFVARISGFLDPKYKLSHLTPYTRYELPHHLENLISSLYRFENRRYDIHSNLSAQSTQEYVTCIDENLDSSMLKLLECLKNLHNYKTENPDYLTALIS